MQYEVDEHYATITQQFMRYDGTRSYYECLSGSEQFTVRLKFRSVINRSKAEAKKLVYEILKQHVWDLDSFKVIDNNYGWTYERYVKVDEEDISKCEIVNKGEHTDHEVFDVYVFYIYEDVGAYSKLL